MSNAWKNGPQDPPFVIADPQGGRCITFDPDDKLGSMYMLDHDFKGCVTMGVSKEVIPESGCVLLDGQKVPHVVKKIQIMSGFEVFMLGVQLAGRLVDYGVRARLSISGFTDLNGNVMIPAEFEVITREQTGPLPQYAEHEAIALQAAEEGIVLLKNDGHALPVPPSTLNVVGEGVYFFQTCAVGAGKINPRYQVDFRQAVDADPNYMLNHELAAFFQAEPQGVPEDALLRRAAEKSDTVVMILVRSSGENMDNSTAPGEYALTDNEKALLRALNRHFAKVVLVLNVGYPIAMDFADDIHVSAILYNGFGGMLAGQALLNVLAGRTTPSGRLTSTWAKTYDDLPSAGNFYDCYHNEMQRYTADFGPHLTTRYDEGVFMGYRYFVTRGRKSAFPFGYGLSYTTFTETVESVAYQENADAVVSVRVKNTGSCPGKQVVQLYVGKPRTTIDKPLRELVAFNKTETLQPGEEQSLTLCVDGRCLDVFSAADQAYLLEGGVYTLYLGEHGENVRKIGCFTVPATIVTRRTQVHMTGERSTPGYSDAPLYPGVEQLPVKELIRLSCSSGDGWGMEGTGEAGRIAKITAMSIPDYVVADGNSGVNMKQRNIGMPSGACYAASFNAELVGEVGRVIGEEARELGISMILGPGFNLQRNPLCGRNPEYFSEDPYLAGMLAAAFAKGLESTGVHGCYKHLVANNAEASRKRNDSVMDESTLRNLYLRSFEIALRAYEPAGMMTSYNLLNGCYTSTDPELVLGVLRREWNFKVFVMTDWGSYLTADTVQMINAGVSWITPCSSDDTYTAPLEKAAEEGRLDIRRLRENVSWMLKTIMK